MIDSISAINPKVLTMPWIDACDANDIDEEDVQRWDHAGATYAIYRSPDDEYF